MVIFDKGHKFTVVFAPNTCTFLPLLIPHFFFCLYETATPASFQKSQDSLAETAPNFFQENCSSLLCGTCTDKQDTWWEEVVGGDCEGSVGIQLEGDLLY